MCQGRHWGGGRPSQRSSVRVGQGTRHHLGGKNIAPTKIESALRSHPLVAHAVAIGDARRHVTALLVLDEEAAPAWARSLGIEDTDLGELSRNPGVLAALDKTVAEIDTELNSVEQVKRYRGLGAPGPPSPAS